MNLRADRREIFRLLGYRGATPDAATEAIADGCAALLCETANAKYAAGRFDICFDAGSVAVGPIKISSASLAKHLCGCGGAFLFAATLGAETDRLMSRLQTSEIEKAAVMQAVAAAALEQWCDDAGEVIAAGLDPGETLIPRFSPGYGDFSPEYQGELLRVLDAPRKIGLFATASGMLAPMKSITAVIGVQPGSSAPRVNGCDRCEKTDCPFRGKPSVRGSSTAGRCAP